ncbi:GGDEF domain-containing protein [Cognatazoarcus halotolerans]|uniref:GGDEF domain-containing protein n=1 Tax=Cognatazoarcus halotolerans TaxID=2686016 RepID=UPI001359E8F8|nr:GGDEF domain-containing protein [Cognatazoarcus halotolerans]MCB1901979.1 diguanylate cyclase [Rhodocyclaceae bacterium]MCP5310014.1 diguanylate cyclase [Zoogloeaceae bacterium]
MTDDTRQSPSEIAREALRRLAMRRIAPTPDNFEMLYHEISGSPVDERFPVRGLKAVAVALPRTGPEAARLARAFEHAVAQSDWALLRQAILSMASASASDQPELAPLLRDLFVEFERPHAGLTVARKREALMHVLSASSDNSLMFQRLSGLLKSWATQRNGDFEASAAALPIVSAADAPAPTGDEPDPRVPLAALLARVLEAGVEPLIVELPELVAEVHQLADAVRKEPTKLQSEETRRRLEALTLRLEWVGEDQRAVRHGLVSLLQLVLQNISDLVQDDRWLHGQLSVIRDAFAGPLDIRALDAVERRLRDVIEKQSHLKRELSDAQQRLKLMLAGFVDRLAAFGAETGEYHDKLELCAKRISEADDIKELSDVVEDIMRETRATQESTLRSREEISELRTEVDRANSEISRLQRDLDAASELVRHDPLTGTLNRKGLDEALEREIARARRRGTTLSLALLDVDNFKNLNDTFGHKTGDEALRHLAEVVRSSLRPQDCVGRYGGEEFLIVLPDTDLDSANATLTRLQRELTKRYFMANNQRLLITFSAGVTRLMDDEAANVAVDRADRAMYAAKRAGKNRVLTA